MKKAALYLSFLFAVLIAASANASVVYVPPGAAAIAVTPTSQPSPTAVNTATPAPTATVQPSPTVVPSGFTSGSTPSVANTTANSCGTTTATIAGDDTTGIITVGAGTGTSCTVTFTTAATARRQCVVNNETTANLARYTYTDTTHGVIKGTFVGGDVVAYVCDTY